MPKTAMGRLNKPAAPKKEVYNVKLDLEGAFTPDPGTEDMFVAPDNKFAFSPGQLSKLLNPKSYSAFYVLGGLAGLEKGLRTNRKTGLSADETTFEGDVAFKDVGAPGATRHGSAAEDAISKAAGEAGATHPPPPTPARGGAFADRKRIFRDNRLPPKKTKSLLQLAWETYNDKILLLLTALALGLYQTFGVQHSSGEPKVEWVEGVAIMVAIIIVVLVGTINDWQMERSFTKLNSKHDDRTVKVIRSGKSLEISVYDIMAGDVMHLSTGDMVPVDGVFIDGHGVKCDESSATGESDLLRKTAADEVFAALTEIREGRPKPKIEKLDPFIISGSKVNEGTGTFLVTAVGVNLRYGRIMMTMQTEHEGTPLQKKLNRLADMIAYAGGAFAAILFLVLFIKFCVALPSNPATPDEKGQNFLRLFITAVTVVVVAVPEGLPLAVTLALAFVTTRMTKDNNLVRVLRACEAMGNATTVCSDKTGTLTQNKMTVVATTLVQRLALLTFIRDNLGAAPVSEARSEAQVVQVVPFDSALKYMASVVKLPDGKFRAYVKGASEILLGRRTKGFADPGSEQLTTAELTDNLRGVFNLTINSYTGQTLRTIGSSYRDFDSWPPPNAISKEDPKAADFNKLHSDMTLVGIFGIKDPLRPTVKDAIKDCQRAGIVVRMVAGDNIITGRAIAKECGIYHPEDGGIAIEGPEFRRKSEEELKGLVPHLQVLARTSPEDKRILVRTLKDLGETVAVTGDGTNDAPALKMADIDFAMRIAGIMWGGAVNDSVKKFLQFQLTVNVTAVVLTFVSSIASATEESTLNAVQLLWVNLIMDTFAALALATDPPTRSVLNRKPDRKSASLITLGMAKMIIGQAICQLAITFVLNFGGFTLLGYKGAENGEKRLKTLVFNTFVWLQIFNEVNNRRLDNKLNILKGVFKNYWFLGVNTIIIGGQILIIFIGGDAFKITPLDGKEWGMSIGLGAMSLPVGALIRLIPDRWLLKLLPAFIQHRWLLETLSEEEQKQLREREAERGGRKDDGSSAEEELAKKPPLRVITSIRGERARKHSILVSHRGLHDYVHDKKVQAHHKREIKIDAKAHLRSHQGSDSAASAGEPKPKSGDVPSTAITATSAE
ncbi:hypothetical protein RB593_006906 [Gaeumannomyces tritici]